MYRLTNRRPRWAAKFCKLACEIWQNFPWKTVACNHVCTLHTPFVWFAQAPTLKPKINGLATNVPDSEWKKSKAICPMICLTVMQEKMSDKATHDK